jgi:hypothetical protein
VPAFVSTLCICIVFVPVFSSAHSEILPAAGHGVIFAMLASTSFRTVADDGEVPPQASS